MKAKIRTVTSVVLFAGILSLCSSAGAQQSTSSNLSQLQFYDQRREVSLLGTVVKFDSASSVPPMGAHVLVQTSSGQVDVHLGNAKVLQANHFELNAGDSVRIVGENMAIGSDSYFAARIVQKGTQAVAVRNAKGFLLTPASAMTPEQKESLQGVR